MPFSLLSSLLSIANETISTLYSLNTDIDKDSNSIFHELFYRSSFFN